VNQKSVANTCRYESIEPALDGELRDLAARQFSVGTPRHAASARRARVEIVGLERRLDVRYRVAEAPEPISR
jgi:hypothetical protein